MPTRRATPVVAFAAFLWAACAHALPVTFSFTGSVTDDPFGLSTFGAPISGSYTFDSAATDTIPDPSTGSYPSVGPAFGFTANVDGTIYSLAGAVTVNTANDIGVDQYGAIASDGTLTLELFFEDATQTALSSDALPLVAPSIASFAFRQFRLFSADAEFLGSIEAFNGTVPEPATVWLLALGLAGLLRPRRLARAV